MRFHVIAVGRARAGPERALFDHYARRLSPPPALIEVEERRPLPGAQRTRHEGELLLARVPPAARVVVLDQTGRSLSSGAFARVLGRWRDDGVADAAFLIGGADGLDGQVLNRADLVLTLGAVTWPHLLVRGLIAEQLYRARCILDGHPYHRG